MVRFLPVAPAIPAAALMNDTTPTTTNDDDDADTNADMNDDDTPMNHKL